MRFKEILETYDVTNVRVGHVVTNNISSELDSLTVILTNISKINIQSYDIVAFTDENNSTTYWLVGNISKTFMTYTEPYLYEYVVDLISPTKLLEIPIPSHTITHIPDTNRGIKRFAEDAIKMYFKLGGRYKNINAVAVFYDYGRNTTPDNTTIQKFIDYNDGHAPECTFEKPTLREYLDYLFGFVGYISRVQIIPYNDTFRAMIYPMDLNPQGNEINSNYIVEITEQMQAESYITQIENNMDEVISPTPVTEYLKIKCEEPIMNEKNPCLLTQYKMYDVKSFKVQIGYNNRFRIDFKRRTPYSSTELGRLKTYIGYTESQIPMSENSTFYTLENGLLKSLADYYEIITISQDGRTKLVYKSRGATDAYYYNDSTNRWNPLDPLPDGISNHRLNNYFALICRPLNPNPTHDIMVIPNMDLDLTNNLVLEEIYQTLTRVSSTDEGKTTSTVQNNALVWQRGSNKINNILDYETRSGLFGIQINGRFALALAVGAATTNWLRDYLNTKALEYSYTYEGTTYEVMYDEISDSPTVEFGDFDTYYDAMSWIFKLNYIPYTSFKVRCAKEGAVHKITSMDSNTNASTDVLFEIKRTKEKIKQLANSNLILQGFSNGSLPVMKVGDYKMLDGEKYTLISLETRHDGTSNVYKGILSKNYSNQVINTIINREKRYYSLPDPSSAVIRHEKIEMHITGQNNVSGYSLRCNMARIMVKRVNGSDRYALLPITTIFSPDNKRITYTVDMGSNAIYGYKVSDENGIGGKIVKTYKYTDDYGRNTEIYFAFAYTEASFADMYDITSSSLPERNELPVIALTYQNGFVKDSREHLIVSLDLIIDDDVTLNRIQTYMSDPDRYYYDKFDITT